MRTACRKQHRLWSGDTTSSCWDFTDRPSGKHARPGAAGAKWLFHTCCLSLSIFTRSLLFAGNYFFNLNGLNLDCPRAARLTQGNATRPEIDNCSFVDGFLHQILNCLPNFQIHCRFSSIQCLFIRPFPRPHRLDRIMPRTIAGDSLVAANRTTCPVSNSRCNSVCCRNRSGSVESF